MMQLKKGMILLTLLLITFSLFGFNYGEALQKAIFFYEAQQAGPLPDWNRVEWRGDATMEDAVLGGWYDAGDHVKFGLPMAYTASMLGWSAYEYKQAYVDSGQWDELENNLRFVLDYFVNAHQGNELVYQIGDGTSDHNWWGPVEVIHKEVLAGNRPAYSTNASCVTGQTAAALAIGSIIFNDPVYEAHAKQLFDIAYATQSDAGYTEANDFYKSWSGFWDEIMWSATWLYIKTNDKRYLDIAEATVAKLNRQGQSSEIEYQWGHAWDDSHYGAMILLARLTGKAVYTNFVEMHLDWWTVGYNGNKIAYTPDGLAWLTNWGSLRHATTTGFLAFVYSDWVTDPVLKARYAGFAEKQVNYALGDNVRGASYEIGYGINSPQHPHHRTAHGSWSDQMNVPENHRHILYGALVGGPGKDGSYTDDIKDFVSNEVACDYNAGFVGSLAKMYSLYGGQALADFPQPEEKEDEFFIEARNNSQAPTYSELKIYVNNRSGWPARMIKDLNFNYYFDLSEAYAAGYTVADIDAFSGQAEFPVTVSEIKNLGGYIYYVNVAMVDGTSIYPGGQSEYAAEVQLRISSPNSASFWDPTNDYSFSGIGLDAVKTRNITLYDGDQLIWGTEPAANGTPIPPASPTPTPGPATPTPTPTPTAAPGVLKVQYKANAPEVNTSQIKPGIKIVNGTGSSVKLSDLTLRYYYTKEGTTAQEFHVDYAQIGSGNLNGSFSDGYVEVGFTAGAGTLAPGSDSGELQLRINKSDWSPFNQADDYSFNGAASAFTDNAKIALFLKGSLVWGSIPGQTQPPTPTPEMLYKLTLVSLNSDAGGGDVTISPESPTGYYPAGTAVTLTPSAGYYVPNYFYPGCGGYVQFDRWYGDVLPVNNVIIMDRDIILTAAWIFMPQPCNTPPPPPTPDPNAGLVSAVVPAGIAPGDDFAIKILLNSGTQKIAAYGFDFAYDLAIVIPNTSIGTGGLTAGADGFVSATNSMPYSKIVASGFDVSGKGPGPALHLLDVHMTAVAEGTSPFTITVNSLVDDTYNDIGVPRGKNTTITVKEDCLCGDVNGDGVVNIVDALLMAQCYVGLPVPFNCDDLCRTDANGDGVVNIVDALMVAQYYVGLLPPMCGYIDPVIL